MRNLLFIVTLLCATLSTQARPVHLPYFALQRANGQFHALAGNDSTVAALTTSLAGSVTPSGSYSVLWEQVDGATVASISDVHSLTPNVTVSQAGSWTFKLTAFSTFRYDVSTVQIIFSPVVQPHTPPTIALHTGYVTTTNEDNSLSLVVDIGDAETAVNALNLTATSSNTQLAPTVFVGGTGAQRTLVISPVANANGSSTIVATVRDADNMSASLTFTATWLAVNDAPTISPISDQTTLEDTSILVPFTINDIETAAGSLTVSASTSPTTMLANAGLSGSGANRTVNLVPNPNVNGNVTVMISVTDGQATTSTSFRLTITPVNDPPSISVSQVNLQSTQGVASVPVTVTVSDVEDLPASLTVTATSDNTSVLPNNGIVFTGTGATRTMRVTAATTGTANILVKVTDTGGLAATANVALLVGSGNTAPTIIGPGAQTINEDTPLSAQPITVGDSQTPPGSLVLSAHSSDQTLVADSGITLGGSGAARTIALTPVANANGSATITLTVTDSGGLTATTTVPLTVNSINDVPTISAIANQATAYQTAKVVSFTVGDVETAPGSLIVSGSSDNTTLVPNLSIVFGGSLANRTATITPANGQSGTANITIQVSDGLDTANTTFQLTVVAGNTAPTISTVANQTTPEDTATSALTFTVGDAETSAGSLTVSASSSDQTIVANATGFLFGGSGANRTVTVTPVANANGATTITLSVSDGIALTSSTFVLTVTAVNDAPTISTVVNQSTAEDTPITVSFSVGDIETAAGSLAVSGTSSDQTKVANASIVFGGSGANRTATITPVLNATGNTTIQLVVSDGSIQSSTSFTLAIAPVNDPPTISAISNQTINEDAATSALAFTVGDVETLPGSLTVSGHSSNQSIVADGTGFLFGGSGASRTVTVTPLANANGVVTITISVSDSVTTTSTSFTLTVTAVNDAPTITAIPNQTINEDGTTGAITFVIGDVETAAASLNLSASSGSTGVIANSGITFGGSGANRTVTVVPVANASGSSLITINVSDGVATTPTTFTVTVVAVNDPPTITTIANQTMSEDGTLGPVSFTIGDVETAAASLTVSGVSGNHAILPDAGITFGGSGASRNFSIGSLVANANGAFTVTITVSDGVATTSSSFTLTVTPINDAPTIAAVPNQTLAQGASSLSITVAINDVDTSIASLTLSATSSNPQVLPVSGITFSGTTASRTVTFTPITSGSSTVTLTVSDGSLTATTASFTVTKPAAVNTAPTIAGPANQTIAGGGAGFASTVLASGLTAPVAFDFAPDGRIFVTEQAGNVRVIKNGALLSTPFHTFANVDTSGERGILGVAFDPNFAVNNFVYLYRTTTIPSTHNTVARLVANGDVSTGTETTVWTIDTPNSSRHNGGAIHFGPDGKLYVAIGDDQRGESQVLTHQFGKVLRINSDGTIPTDNPLYGSLSGNNRAIWAYGLRNPFTFAFNGGAAAAGGRVFYVDQTAGSDLNSGTSTGSAWQHIPGAVGFPGDGWTVLRDTDTIVVKGGTVGSYQVKLNGIQFNGNSAPDSITIISGDVYSTPWGSGPAVIDGGSTRTYGLFFTGVNGITVKGLEIRNIAAGGVDVAFDPNNGSSGIVVGGNAVANFITIDSCHIHDTLNTGTADQGHGIETGGGNNLRVVNCEIGPNIGHKGIESQHTDNSEIAHNYIHDTLEHAIVITANNCDVHDNIIDMHSPWFTDPEYCIKLNNDFNDVWNNLMFISTPARGSQGFGVHGNNNRFVHNTVYGFESSVSNGGQYGTAANIGFEFVANSGNLVGNNLLLHCSQPEVGGNIQAFIYDASVSPSFIYNDLWFTSGSENVIDFGHTSAHVYQSVATFQAAQPSIAHNNQQADPLITGGSFPTGFASGVPNTAYFTLTGSSPAAVKNTGNVISGDATHGRNHNANKFATDINGFPRTVYSMGAYETGSTPTVTPPPPNIASIMYINDVGEGTDDTIEGYEEIDSGVAGANYGWPTCEGPYAFQTTTACGTGVLPFFYYTHLSGAVLGKSIVGAAFYNPAVVQFPASYVGKYFFGDYINGWIRYLDSTTKQSTLFTSSAGGVVDIHIGPDGKLYWLNHDGGAVNVIANSASSTSALAVTVGDAETAANNLVLTGISSNPTLVPNANIVFGGSGSGRTVTVTSAAGQTGTATITLTVTDAGGLTANASFTVTVGSTVNTPPTIALTGNSSQSTSEDSPLSVTLTVGDNETAANSLVVTAVSSNPTLVPNGNISITSTGTTRTATITPALNQNGTSTIVFTVTDGGGLTANVALALTVTAVNDPPTITGLVNKTLGLNAGLQSENFTVGDVETAAASLTVTASSGNTTLIPAANISLGGSGSARTISFTPATGATGTATITVFVSDGTTQSSQSFTVTVSGTVAAGWWVSTTGSSGNAGTFSSPWDIRTAFAGGNGLIQPGDTVWVMDGVYKGADTANGYFTVSTVGTKANPITFRPQNLYYGGTGGVTFDRAHDPGFDANCDANNGNDTRGCIYMTGRYTTLRDFEICNNFPRSKVSGGENFQKMDCIDANFGGGNKYYDIFAHDGENNINLQVNQSAPGDSILGCLNIFGGDLSAMEGGAKGGSSYLQNYVGDPDQLMTYAYNILAENFNRGLEVNGQTDANDASKGAQYNITIHHNVSFNEGSVGLWAVGPTMGAGMVVGTSHEATNLTVFNNKVYTPTQRGGGGISMGTVTAYSRRWGNYSSNYVVGIVASICNQVDLVASHNTWIADQTLDHGVLKQYPPFDYKTTVSTGTTSFDFDTIYAPASGAVCRINGNDSSWAQWQGLGFDAHGTVVIGMPTSNAIFRDVIPDVNGETSILMNLTIFNWTHASSVTVDLSVGDDGRAFAVDGDHLEFYYPLDPRTKYFTIVKAGTVTIPMNQTPSMQQPAANPFWTLGQGASVDAPWPACTSGGAGHPESTLPEFGSFRVVNRH